MKTCIALLLLAASVVLTGCGSSSGAPEPRSENPTPGALAAPSVMEEQAPSHLEKQVVETAELMKLLVDPIYEDLKDAIEVAPKGRKKWRALYIAAFSLAEVNNLLFSRADEEFMLTSEWVDECLKAQRVLNAFAKSVRAQSEYEVLKENYLAVMGNCNDCHRTFSPGEVDEIVPPTSWNMEVEEDPESFTVQ